MPLVIFFSLIVLTMVMSFNLMHALGRVSKRYFLLRLILLPGVIVHELAHVLALLITNTPIERISFWTETGGAVVHHKPKLAVLVQPFISLAPFPVGVASLFMLSRYLTSDNVLVVLAVLFLMISVAATLAPSRVDLIAAFEGGIVIAALAVGVYYFYPGLIENIYPWLETFNLRLIVVTLMLAVGWLGLQVLHIFFRRVGL